MFWLIRCCQTLRPYAALQFHFTMSLAYSTVTVEGDRESWDSQMCPAADRTTRCVMTMMVIIVMEFHFAFRPSHPAP